MLLSKLSYDMVYFIYIYIYIYVKGEHGCRHDYSEGRKNSMKLSEVLLNS